MDDRPSLSSTTSPHILVVDDEDGLRRTLSDLLRRIGYQTTEATCGEEALEHITRHVFDVVLLDLNMPGMDGTEVLRVARPMAPDTVFIILTAYGTLDSAIVAIQQGAFNYLLKPSPTAEIIRAVESGLAERRRRLGKEDPLALIEQALTSLKATNRRVASLPQTNRFLQAPGLMVDTFQRLVIVDGQPVTLTPTEFEILTYLMRHRNRVVPPRELAAHLHDYELDKQEARTLLRSHIYRLRHKLGCTSSRPCWVRTVRGSGYIFSDE